MKLKPQNTTARLEKEELIKPEPKPYMVYTNKELEAFGYDPNTIETYRELEQLDAHTTQRANVREIKKMATIAESAKDYESKTTKNIAELDKVSVDLDLVDDEFEFTDKDGNQKKVQQKVIIVGEEKYRVPISVIQQLQAIIEEKPDLKEFKVKKTGEGKENTKYTVITL